MERAAAILRSMSGGRSSIGVVELARLLELPKGTVHGLLRTLQEEGFVEQDGASGRYRLGAALLALGTQYLEASPLRIATLNAAQALAARTGESVRVGALHEGRVLIVHHLLRPDTGHQRLDVGVLLPVHATSLGKALLVHRRDLVPPAEAGPLHRFTPATITEVSCLERELDVISGRGWASEIAELVPGVASIAVPIAPSDATEAGAIGIEGPIDRVREPRAAERPAQRHHGERPHGLPGARGRTVVLTEPRQGVSLCCRIARWSPGGSLTPEPPTGTRADGSFRSIGSRERSLSA